MRHALRYDWTCGPLVRRVAWGAAASIAAAALVLVFVGSPSATHYDSMFKTANANWNCINGGPTYQGNEVHCQNDNSGLTVYRESSLSAVGKSAILAVLNDEFEPTDLSVTVETSGDYSGGSETDIIYQGDVDLPGEIGGVAWCDDANNSTQCDQHYVAFDVTSPGYRVICHETGHAVGLVHGPQADPSQSDNTASLGCMGTAVGQSNLGSHNQDQIDATY